MTVQALEIIPYTLAENAATTCGWGRGGDMWEEHVVQPLLVNLCKIKFSTKCVGMTLKIDDLIVVR